MSHAIFDRVHLTGLNSVEVKGLSLEGGKINSIDADPWVEVRPYRASAVLLIELTLDEEAYQSGDALRVYYSDGSAGYSEERCAPIMLSGLSGAITALYFEKPVEMIRLDFTERVGALPLIDVRVSAYHSIDAFVKDRLAIAPTSFGRSGTVVVTHDLSNTGAPILACNISRALCRRGRSILTFHIGDSDAGLRNTFLSEDMALLPLFLLRSAGNESNDLELALLLLRCLCASGYDSAILNTVLSGAYAGLFKQAGFNVVTLVHETAETIRMHDWVVKAREIAMFSDRVVFPCDGVKDGFLDLVARVHGEVAVRPQGVYLDGTVALSDEIDDLLWQLGIEQDSKLVLSSGTVELRKGADLFLSAATSLCERDEKVRVVWVGNGFDELSSWLKIQLSKTRFQDSIQFVPFMDAARYKALLERADVFWSTSRNDTFPSVVLEAMREGVPVVAFSGAIGVDAMLADGRGVLVDDYSVEGVADETDHLLNDNARAFAIADRAQSWVADNLSFADYIDDLCRMCDTSQVIDKEYVDDILSSEWDETRLTPSLADTTAIDSLRAARQENDRAEFSNIFSRLFRRQAEEIDSEAAPVLLDVSLGSDNIGDHVIMDYCLQACSVALATDRFDRVPTHRYAPELDHIRGKLKILCGTNLIYTHMEQSTQWAFPHDVRNFDNLCMLGVGMQDLGIDEPFSEYSLELLHLLLDNKWLHSVSDGYTMRRLREIGIKNVVNTACPTMWNLTPSHCSSIPKDKAPCCVATVTCHLPDADTDAYMLQTLLSEYKHVFIWLQGPYDYTYCLKGVVDPTAFTILPPSLEALDRVLERDDVDYVGTRLHAGIRALNHGRRSLVVTVDNRARHISQDTGLPTLERTELGEKLTDWINGSYATEIVLPEEAIAAWKAQFKQGY